MFASEIPAIIALMVGLLFVPHSPRWLAAKGRDEEALDVLTGINGPEEAARELGEIKAELAEETGTARELLAPGIRTAVLVGAVLMVFSQINGVNFAVSYMRGLLDATA